MAKRIYFFDTTLRDGEQTPGVSFNLDEKVEIALRLENLGIDIIEAGFANASPGDAEAIRAVAKAVSGPIVVSLARTNKDDIDAVINTLGDIDNTGIHIFIATSPIHRERKLGMTKEQVLEKAVESVSYAAKYFKHIEFSCEDATRTELEFLSEVAEKVVEAGATVLNFPDTVGYTTPEEYTKLFQYVLENTKGIEKVRLSCHCHDDLGMALSNSIAAIQAGAVQVEGCINGIGERAGNVALEEVAALLETRKDYFNIQTGIKLKEIAKTSKLISRLTGIAIPPNKAVIGGNAFSHSSGIHQDGVIKDKATYEIMTPESIGFNETKLVLGKLSGRNALKKRYEELGYSVNEAQLKEIFKKYKELADRKKDIFDEDIIALLETQPKNAAPSSFTFNDFSLQILNHNQYRAFVNIIGAENTDIEGIGDGNGPIDAIYKGIDSALGLELELIDYKINSISKGKDSIGEVFVKVRNNDKMVSGRAINVDIIVASANAYIDAINRLKVTNVKTLI
ncbi:MULTISPECIES: 2-isopropylmalate synthase [Neobacillus]|uniref:2-isopropylmalate synthase n=1 Tax=Neobacillus rhizophilus TaxID=2833579 RepID=A0A942U1A5_9BACI|nr:MULTISPECIES: 2-isopropylmalate synthase [Neobacillus]MBS4211415.1 2-isopropylmalate synthase [Neobacillus rhizophilus]MBU8916833.1 2-isopropylmalate synthase [Bacillus sp. FJAT-29953]